jgi:hypothetical protein
MVVDALRHKMKMARLRIREVHTVQDMLEQGAMVGKGKIYVNNLKLAPDLR